MHINQATLIGIRPISAASDTIPVLTPPETGHMIGRGFLKRRQQTPSGRSDTNWPSSHGE